MKQHIFIVAALALTMTSVTAAVERVALVIGNAAYTSAPLKNPVNDARAISGRLQSLGFEVTRVENATLTEMRVAVARFGQALLSSPTADAVVFFAGHGIQSRGVNYLMPVNASMESEAEARATALELNTVLRELEARDNGVNIIILDACRNNPFASRVRGASRGLAPVRVPTAGTLVAYATEPGRVAEDGEGENGVFTAALLEALEQPGLDEDDLFEQVLDTVERRTGKQQRPWMEGRLRGDFVFNASAPPTQPQSAAAVPSSRGSDRGEIVFWETVKDADNPAMFEAYLQQWPQGTFAALARIRIDELKAASTPATAPDGDSSGTSPAPQQVPTPPATETPERERIASLLADAEQDLAALRLTSPAGRNAVDKYREVLRRDEGNTQARAGLAAVVDAYVKLAGQTSDRGRRRAYLERADAVVPGTPVVAKARDRLLTKGPDVKKPGSPNASDKASKGWLGVQAQALTADAAKAVGRRGTQGALVVKVLTGSPAEAGDIRAGDIVLSVNGEAIAALKDLPRVVNAIPAGKTARIAVWRSKKRLNLRVKIGRRPDND